MAKQKTVFVCGQCGYECTKWLGQCPSCKAWNTLEEMPLPDTIRQAHPELTEDEWSSFTRLVTLIFTSLTTKSGKSK
mgnify:CR=1 FL=1